MALNDAWYGIVHGARSWWFFYITFIDQVANDDPIDRVTVSIVYCQYKTFTLVLSEIFSSNVGTLVLVLPLLLFNFLEVWNAGWSTVASASYEHLGTLVVCVSAHGAPSLIKS